MRLFFVPSSEEVCVYSKRITSVSHCPLIHITDCYYSSLKLLNDNINMHLTDDVVNV